MSAIRNPVGSRQWEDSQRSQSGVHMVSGWEVFSLVHSSSVWVMFKVPGPSLESMVGECLNDVFYFRLACTLRQGLPM